MKDVVFTWLTPVSAVPVLPATLIPGICAAVPVPDSTTFSIICVRVAAVWGDGERVFKIVSFYLLRYLSGEIDDIAPEMRIEVNRALWIPLADAAKKLGYSNERKVIRLAEEYLQSHPEV